MKISFNIRNLELNRSILLFHMFDIDIQYIDIMNVHNVVK